MEATARPSPRREGAVAVHSLHRFVFTVPDLDVAGAFYTDFGLDVRRIGDRLDLHTFGHEHRWGSVYKAAGPKRLQYVSFGAYADDYDRIVRRVKEQGVATIKPHALADEEGTWFADPDGTAVQLVVSRKVSPAEKTAVPARAARGGTRRRAVARGGRQGAAAPAVAHPAVQLRRAALGRASTRTRSGCACPTTPATSSPSCTARMRATIT